MTPAEALREKLEVSIIPDELFAENCYVVRRRDTAAALVIDPGLQVAQVQDHVEREGLTIERILLTHGHIDHIAGVSVLHEASGAPVAMHPDDLSLLDWERLRELPFVPRSFGSFTIDVTLAHAAIVNFQDVTLQVLHTPGHTQGSACFLFGLDCFAGDTLFQRSIGRTDLRGGNFQQLIVSIREVLYSLPPKTAIYPGHGPGTTIEEEKLLNPFVPG